MSGIRTLSAVLIIALAVAFSVIGAEKERAIAQHAWDVVIDDVTGVRLSIPRGVVGDAKKLDYGRNWEAPGKRLSIDTLVFKDRKLDDLYKTLRSKSGRTIARGTIDQNGFVLEGSDQGSSTFHIVAHYRDHEIRGLSIVYSNNARQQMQEITKAVLKSFEPFPVPAATETDANSAYVEDIRGRLKEQVAYLKRKDFALAAPEVIERLPREALGRYRLQLESGRNYMMLASCDRDCNHVELALLNADSKTLARSSEKLQTVMLAGEPQMTGAHELEVGVPGCKQMKCHVGILVFQQGGTAGQMAISKW